MVAARPIDDIEDARQRLRVFLQFMETERWSDRQDWDVTVTQVRRLVEAAEENPPDADRMSSIELALSKGGGCDITIDACPSFDLYLGYVLAKSWIYRESGWLERTRRRHNLPPSPPERFEEQVDRANRVNQKARAHLAKPVTANTSLPNTPEGWARIEQRLGLPAGTYTNRKPDQLSPYVVARTQLDGSKMYVPVKHFPGRVVAISGPAWKRTLFRMTRWVPWLWSPRNR